MAKREWKIPNIEDRHNGLEVLAWHRGKWRHVKWSDEFQMWSLGYGMEFIEDAERAFAPIPTPPEPDTFFEWSK